MSALVVESSTQTTRFRGNGGCCCGIGACWIITLATLWNFIAIALLCGVAVMPLGMSKRSSAGRLNPAEDFTSLGPSSCTIQDIYTAQRTERRVRIQANRRIVELKCYHDYTYLFTYSEGSGITIRGGGGGEVLESRTESHLMYEQQCPPTLSDPHKGKFYTGERAECWVPTGPGPWAPEYNCGNPACIKLFSPFDERDLLLSEANNLITTGIVLMGVAAVAAAAMGLLTWCLCTGRCRRGSHTYPLGPSHEAYPMLPMQHFPDPEVGHHDSSADEHGRPPVAPPTHHSEPAQLQPTPPTSGPPSAGHSSSPDPEHREGTEVLGDPPLLSSPEDTAHPRAPSPAWSAAQPNPSLPGQPDAVSE